LKAKTSGRGRRKPQKTVTPVKRQKRTREVVDEDAEESNAKVFF
jgi:hypothetical protein